MKKQMCKQCEQELKLTEIATNTGQKVYAYMCDCNEMVQESIKIQNTSSNSDYTKCPECGAGKGEDKMSFSLDGKILADFDKDEQILSFRTDINGMIEKAFVEQVCFKDRCVREALISLGWTPPPAVKERVG